MSRIQTTGSGRWLKGAVGAFLLFVSMSAFAQINNGGSFANGQSDYATFTCTYCHDTVPDGGGTSNQAGANVQAVITNQINAQVGCGVNSGMGEFSASCPGTVPCSATANPSKNQVCTLTAQQLKDLAAYIGGYTAPIVTNFSILNVPYGGSSNFTVTTSQVDPNIVAQSVATADAGPPYSGTATRVQKASNPAHGAVVSSGLTLTYTSSTAGGYFANDSFTYTASNTTTSTFTSTPATVTVTITEPPVGEVSNPTPLAVTFNTPLNIDLSAFATGSYNTSFVVTAGPSHGAIGGTTFTPGSTITYTPTTGYFGPDTITFHVVGTPSSNVSGNGTISLQVGNPPAPTASNYTYPTPIAWDSPTNTIDLTGSVSTATTNHVVLFGAQPAGGTVTASGLQFNYAANPNFAGGTDTFQYEAVGPLGLTSAPATVTVTVNAPPIPTLSNSSTSVPFKSPGTVLTLGTVTPTGDPITGLTVTTQGTHGVATVTGAPTNPIITYVPTSGYFGTDTVGYTASNSGGTSAPASIAITVPQPGPPMAVPVTASASYATPTVIDLSADFGGLAQTLSIVSPGPANGNAVVGTGANALKITYTPSAAFQGGPDNFSYIADGYGTGNNSSPALISMTVAHPGAPTTVPVTPPPVAYNSSGVAIALAGAVTSATAFTVAIATMPTHGLVALSGTTATYTPAMGYIGADSFTFTASNGGGVSNASAVNITVNPPPPPTVSNLTLGVPYNTPAMLNLATPPPPATGPQGVYTSVSLGATAPAHGMVSLTGSTVTYTPTSGYFGADSFTYVANGPGGTSTPGTVSVTVALPGAPVANAASLNVPYSGTGSIDVSMNSIVTGNYSSVAIASQGTHGVVTLVGTTFTYTPAALYFGADSFTYTAHGPGGTSAPGTISVLVATPGAPTVTSSAFNVTFNTPMTTNLASTVSGVYSTLAIVTAPTHGVAVLSGTNLTYTPAATYYGTDTLTYTAHGPGGTSAPATVTLTIVRPAPPVANNATLTTPFGKPLPVNLINYVTGIATSATVSTPPLNGTVAVSGMTLTYTPAAGFFGQDIFSYTVTGPGGTSAPAVVTVTVQTSAAKAWNTSLSLVVNTTGSINLGNFTTGSGITGIGLATAPQHGQAVVAGMVLAYTPAPNFFGTDTLTYVAYGATGQSPPATLTITVTGRPDPRQNPDVPGIVTSEGATAQRFVDTQIANFQTHMQALHAVSTDDQDVSANVDPNAAFNKTPESPVATERAASSKTTASAAPPGAAASAAPVTLVSATGSGYTPQASQALASVSSSSSILPPVGATSMANAVASSNPSAPLGFGGATMQRTVYLPGIAVFGPPAPPQGVDLTSLDVASMAGSMMASQASQSVDHLGLSSAWVLGSVAFGSRTPGGSSQGFDTDGISFGIDDRLSNQLVVGIGAGYAQDKTLIGTDGANTHANGTDLAVYASFAPTKNTYVDAVFGIGSLSFDSTRPVTQIDAEAVSHRSGDQVFASLAAGYDWRDQGVHVSPYTRLDVSDSRLNSVSESGASAYDLTYGEQNQSSASAALGLRADTTQMFDYGQVTPHVSVEYDHQFENGREVNIQYASLTGGTTYPITPNILDRNTLVVGFGTDFLLTHGLTVGWDYEVLKAPGQESSQMIRVKLSQNLDKAFELPSITSNPFANIQTDFDYVYDDNVGRSTDRLADQAWSLNFSRFFFRNLNDNVRVTIDPTAGFEKFETYIGLSHADLGAKAQLQYRGEGDFGTPTYSLFARVTGSEYESAYRSGERYSAGGSVLVPLTDRINVFGEVGAEQRHGSSAVWDDTVGYARTSVDYALTPSSSLYAGAEYRAGEFVSSGLPTLANLDTAQVYVADPAFPGLGRVAYRLRATAGLFNLGLNTALSPSSSLDLSWRIVASSPDHQPDYFGAPSIRYIDHQWTLVYLVRF